ncbi:MAG: PH domain-containing protein [Syntrophomonadaceae bacterium]|nr:PH domain-containing protein [Syntrophomonadaceae bacterium]
MYEPHRLHPAAILEFLITNIYKLVQAMLPLMLLALGNSVIRKWLIVILPLMLLCFIIYGALYWLRYVYYIQDHELRLEFGVIVRKKRYISFERIQTVQVSAGVIQRLFGLVKLQVETAGSGSNAELSLPAVSRAKAEALQMILQNTTGFKSAVANEEDLQQFQLTTPALLLLGSTSNSLGLVLAGMLTIISQLDKLIPGENIWERFSEYAGQVLSETVGTILLILVAVFLLAWLLSLLGNIILFGGFSLKRDGDNLKISRGLLEKKQLTIPIRRIQAVRLVEGILRQPLGMVSIKVVTISNTGEKGEGNVIMPIIALSEAEDFLRKVVPEFYVSLDTEPLPLRSRIRYIAINLIPALVMVILASYFLPYGYLSLILLPLALGLGKIQYRDAGLKVQDGIMLIRSRTLGRVSTIIPRPKIQSLSITYTYFQARNTLTTLKISIASGTVATWVKLVGMDENRSLVISQWFSRSLG